MHGVLRGQPSVATEIQGHFVQGRDKIVPPPNWVAFARYCWPIKTANELALIAGKDERTAKRWMAGEFDPPKVVMAALVAKLFE